MTSKNYFNKIGVTDGKQYLWLSFMSFAFVGFMSTALFVILVFNQVTTGQTQTLDSVLDDSFLITGTTVLLAVLSGINLFKYLNQKSEVDFFHSIPVKKQLIFLNRYIMGLSYFIFAIVFHYVVCYLLGLSFDMLGYLTFKDVMVLCLMEILLFFSVYSFTIFGVVVTGNTFMSVSLSLGLVFTPYIFTFTLRSFIGRYYRYYPGNYDYSYFGSSFVDVFFNPLIAYGMESIFMMFLQGFVLGLVSFFCYMKRPDENSGVPVAIPQFRQVIKVIGVMSGCFAGGYATYSDLNPFHFLLGAFGAGLLLSMAFEMLFEQDIRACFKNFKQFPIIYAVVCVMTLGISLDFTNYDQRLASLEEIQSITHNGITVETPENIALLYSAVVDFLPTGSSSLYYGEGMNMGGTYTFHLKNGTSYTRAYYGTTLTNDDYFSLIHSPEYFKQFYNYALNEEELRAIEKTGDDIRVTGNFKKESITFEEFELLYLLLQSKLDELTPEYLRQNIPFGSIRVTSKESRYLYSYIPIYEVHTEVLEGLELKQPEIPEVSYLLLSNDIQKARLDDYTKYKLDDMDQEIQDKLMEEAVFCGEYSEYFAMNNYKIAGLCGATNKDASLYAYIPIDRFLEVFGDVYQDFVVVNAMDVEAEMEPESEPEPESESELETESES